MPLDPLLIEVLACPVDKGPLLWFADEDLLYNPRLHRSYDVRDGIPVLLVDEATAVDDAEHERLMAKAAAGGVARDRDGPAGGVGSRRVTAGGAGVPPVGRARPAGRLARHVGGRPPASPSRSRRRPGRLGRVDASARGAPSPTSWSWAWAAAASPATCWRRWPRPDRPCR